MQARTSRRSAIPKRFAQGEHRDSHFESAQEADDIYTLYGPVNDDQVGVAVSPDPQAHLNLHTDDVEQLDDERHSPEGEEDVFSTPRDFGDDMTDYMPVDYSARGEGPDWSQTYREREQSTESRGSHALSAYSTAEEASPQPHASPIPESRKNSEGRVRRPSGQDNSFDGLSRHTGGMERRPSGQSGAGMERRPSGQSAAGVERRPSGQSSLVTGVERRPSGQSSFTGERRPSGGVERRPSGQDDAIDGMARRPSGQEPGVDELNRRPSGTASAVPPHMRGPGTPERAGSLSPPSSSGNSPVHPSIARINNTSRNVSGASGTTDGQDGSSIGASDSSLVSSRYPGEEFDAFHVRSTYARLEVEGVYGDGWDEGVERTRGGMASRPRRVTMVFPTNEGGIPEKEQQFLSSLDRYGFVDTPAQARSEGRLAFVPAAPFGKVPKVRVRSSFGGEKKKKKVSPAKGEPPGPSMPPAKHPDNSERNKQRRKEEERVSKWLRMMTVAKRDSGHNAIAWRWSSEEGEKYRTRIYKGIPDRWRMAAWWTLAEERAKAGSRVPNHESLEADYQSRRDQASENDVQIDLDVPRTISGHALFKTRFGHGQRALFHVLHCFSQSCYTCGYCQGMGSVAATLLCYFEPERAYTLMVRLHDQYNMHGIFAPGFPGLLESFYVQERLLEAIMPDVYESFQRNMISSSAWGAKIYITLFVNVVPFNTQLRIWDALWLDGYDVMVIAVLALLWAFRPLLAHPAANFESILSLLSSYYVVEDEDAMLEWMRKMLWQPGVKELIAHWRREWKSLADRGKTDGLLL